MELIFYGTQEAAKVIVNSKIGGLSSYVLSFIEKTLNAGDS